MFDVILDRDGVLNVDVGYTYHPEDLALVDGVVETLTALRDAGARFSIATGQSGIARGKYRVEDMETFNRLLVERFMEYGIMFAATAFCPHLEDGECDCRKPKTGMLRQIEALVGPIQLTRSWGIGDKPSDSEMILSAGGRAILLKSPYWRSDDPSLVSLLANPRHRIADTMRDVPKIIIPSL